MAYGTAERSERTSSGVTISPLEMFAVAQGDMPPTRQDSGLRRLETETL
jgi:hypothetical protein